MQLKIINSNSLGNAYILESGDEALLIECGVQFKKIKQALNFRIDKVVGCLVTHEHGDHSIAMKEVLSSGIKVYATDGTFKALNLQGHHHACTIYSGKEFFVGSFKIKPFDIQHDVAEPVGFIIEHPECGRVLFITDSFYCKYTFPGLNQVIIEANYCKQIIDQRVKDGANPKFLRDRVLTSHMSLQTCKGMLAANDLSQVKNVVLIHLSDGNSDEKKFKREVEQLTGKPVHIASAGMTIDLNDEPF